MPQKMYYGGTTFPSAYKKGGRVKSMEDCDDDGDMKKAKGGKVSYDSYAKGGKSKEAYAKGGKTKEAYAKGGPIGTKKALPAGRVMEKKKGGMC